MNTIDSLQAKLAEQSRLLGQLKVWERIRAAIPADTCLDHVTLIADGYHGLKAVVTPDGTRVPVLPNHSCNCLMQGRHSRRCASIDIRPILKKVS